MAHQLMEIGNTHALAFVGDTPWHGLGTKLAAPMTAQQALEAAHLDYDVQLRPLECDGVPLPNYFATVRADVNLPLGVVGSQYRVVQNRDCFRLLDSLVEEGELAYHTAGALGKGERVWMLAKLPEDIQVQASEDVVEQYLLLSNSHDGTSSLKIFFTPIRVVCANTLAVADRNAIGRRVSISHRGDATVRVANAREILGLSKSYYRQVNTSMQILSACQPSRTELELYFESLYPSHLSSSRAKNRFEMLLHLFEFGRGQNIPETRRSMWSAFNAVTEYVDHHRPARGGNARMKNSNRLESSWFGSGARLKEKAWELALQMAS